MISLEGQILLVVHPQDAVRDRLAKALRKAGGRVMPAGNDEEAWLRADTILEPDIVVAWLDGATPSDSWIGDRLRASSGRRVAIVALAERRRDALRRGYDNVVGPPFDDEEVLLVVQSSLERERSERSLNGDLSQLTVPDLLQTTAINGQSGRVALRSGPKSGEIWLRDGRVIDARIDASDEAPTKVGREAVYDLVTWSQGTFSVDFGPTSAVERISESTIHLVLEALRRLDEARRRRHPGHAGMPDEPPPPTPEQKAAHLALLILNISASWASDRILPTLLGRMLEESRLISQAAHPILETFQVDKISGRVAYRAGTALVSTTEQIGRLAKGTAAWLRNFYDKAERAMPGHYHLDGLAVLTEAHQEDLATLGFARELGWPGPEEKAAPTAAADPQQGPPAESLLEAAENTL